MNRSLLVAGALLGVLGILAGTFAAHGLATRLEPELLRIYETGVRYHVYHALATVMVGGALARFPGRWIPAAGWLFVAGTVVFSGSLYLLAITGARWLGAITPIGGAAFVAGWVALAIGGFRARG